MGELVLGAASSHAFALQDPSRWDEHRQRNREMYAKRFGALPPEQPGIAQEMDDKVFARYANLRAGFNHVRDRLAEVKPDVLVMIGDDQNENFTEDTFLPQMAMFTGESFVLGSRGLDAEGLRYQGHPGLAEAILVECVDSDIDMAHFKAFPDELLRAHAFGPVLRVVDPEARLRVLPIFVNAIHVPAPSAKRCYYLGQAIGRAIAAYPDSRVAVYASGGLSHFTGGYPWKHYEGPFGYGAISVDFDHDIVEKMREGRGSELANLTNQEIIGNGEIELRSWITLMGIMGDRRPESLVYEPFYRGIMGMAVGCWDLQPALAGR